VPADMVDGYYLPFQQKGGVKALIAWSKWSAVRACRTHGSSRACFSWLGRE
jgi:hypothetical protein